MVMLKFWFSASMLIWLKMAILPLSLVHILMFFNMNSYVCVCITGNNPFYLVLQEPVLSPVHGQRGRVQTRRVFGD